MIDWLQLRAAAQAVATRAYAPYSKFHVGAALLSEDGRIWSGCNVENASYGLSICAERNAVFGAIAHGVRRFVACAVLTSARAPVTPCGACRQVLNEFGPSFEVRCYGSDGSELATTTGELLPHAFSDVDLDKARDEDPPP